MSSNMAGLPGPVPPLVDAVVLARDAVQVCVALSSLGPQESVAQLVAAGLKCVGRVLGADSGHFGISTRRCAPEGDPLLGWRLDVFYGLGPKNVDGMVIVDEMIQTEEYLQDPGVQATARAAGRHRIYHDPDPRTVPERAGSIDARSWDFLELVDRLKLVYALSEQVELHFAFDRGLGSQPYLPSDVAMLQVVLEGFEPWAQRLAFVHGYLDGHTPLSPRERALACALLGSEPLKRIADAQGISEAHARDITRDVYRKLAVDGRLELVNAWACAQTAPVEPIAAARRARR